MAVGHFIRVGDSTTCGGKVLTGDAGCNMFGRDGAREGDSLTCGKDGKVYTIVGGIPTLKSGTQRVAGTAHSISSCPCNAKLITSLSMATYEYESSVKPMVSSMAASAPNQFVNPDAQMQNLAADPVAKKPVPLSLPALIFTTQRKMDDYAASDMKYGDLTEDMLRNEFNLVEFVAGMTDYDINNKAQSAQRLFDEFRNQSDTFSFQGEYQGIIRKLIDHMQANSGTPFSDPLLDKAMKERILEDDSDKSSLELIKNALVQHIDWDEGYYLFDRESELQKAILESILPKFNNMADRVNGLGISVHDTWSTHIFLQALEVNGDSFKATVRYRIQDHFGLGGEDINSRFYRSFRIFRIWFLLQRWQAYGYKPFITEINTTVVIEGHRGG